ncbi:DUF4956 domain-containing protein [Pseudomonadota bacterium]|nr:DUF4956 domain-containing protein [Pseudomonadota bacterium]
MILIDTILANLDKLTSVAFLLFFSILTRYSILLNGQSWVKTFSSTLTLILLPIITYSITSVISGNIALSLGMIGALSIVRFRNPVRSSFELVIFFLMITLGICASVGVNWLIVLGLSSNGILLAAHIFNQFLSLKMNIKIFAQSFSEANDSSILEITSNKPMQILYNHEDLRAYNYFDDKYSYKISSDSQLKLKQVAAEMEKIEEVESVQLHIV